MANRQTWTIAAIDENGGLLLRGGGRERQVPAEYAARHVELAHATTVHGAQGDTVDRAYVALSDTTEAAAAYVAMTRGGESNTAHLVAESIDDARQQEDKTRAAAAGMAAEVLTPETARAPAR